MSGSDRGKGTPLIDWALPLVGIVLALCLAALLGILSGREGERRHQAPHRHAQSAKADAERACVRADPSAVFECVYDKVEASEETARTEQDLSAQQRAATAALASAVIAFITLLITAIGVWFVKRTLDATLEAVRDTSIATKAMERQNELAAKAQRPWLDFNVEILRAIDFADHAVYIKVTARNHSSFPAHDVRASARGNFISGGLMGAMDATNHRPAIEAELERVGRGGTAFPHNPFASDTIAIFSDPQAALTKPGSPPAKMMVGIRYRFDGGHGYTFKVFNLFGLNGFIEEAKNPSKDVLGKVRGLHVDMKVDPATVLAR